MLKLVLIAAGGAAGTLLRYAVTGLEHKFSNNGFPINTLIVNLCGSLVIGALWGLFERLDVSTTTRTVIFVGVLGAFTTFSTFSFDSFTLLRNGEFKIAFVNIASTNFLGLGAVFIGYFAARGFLTFSN